MTVTTSCAEASLVMCKSRVRPSLLTVNRLAREEAVAWSKLQGFTWILGSGGP